MKDEKKVNEAEEVKAEEEEGVELTDEELEQVTGGSLRDPKGATFTWSSLSGNVPVLQEPQLDGFPGCS